MYKKNLGGVQVICNMLFFMLHGEHEMANQSSPGGVKLHPLTLPENPPMNKGDGLIKVTSITFRKVTSVACRNLQDLIK